MTWHHVTLITVAIVAVVACAHNVTCAQALPAMIDLAKLVIVGVMGHAGATYMRGRLTMDREPSGSLRAQRAAGADGSDPQIPAVDTERK